MLAAVICLLLPAASADAASAERAHNGQLIVGFHGGTSAAEARRIVGRTDDAQTAERLPGGALVLDVEPGGDVADVADDLAEADGVRFVTPNYLVHASDFALDPLLADGSMWGILRLHAATAWSTTSGSSTVVAVLDGGANLGNPELSANLWSNPAEIPGNGIDDDNNGFVDDIHGADWIDRDGAPGDTGGHGTHVAGTIAAAAGNGIGGAGVAPGTKLMVLRFLDGRGSGTVADAASAIDYAIAKGADVINASWGGPDHSPVLRDAIARAAAAGITVVTAAGNDGTSNDKLPTWPASYRLPNVISVAASDQRDQLAPFSNRGQSVTVAAPGVGILSTYGAGTGRMSGTSMAAPHVAGIVALLRSAHPGLSPQAVIGAIRNGARPVAALKGRVAAGGVADAAGALQAIGAPVPSTERGAAPGSFRLNKPGKRVRIRGRKGIVRFSWTKSRDNDLIGYDVIVGGKVRAHVRSTHARIRVSTGRLKWRVIAVDAEGNQTSARRTAKSSGRISVLRVKPKKHRR